MVNMEWVSVFDDLPPFDEPVAVLRDGKDADCAQLHNGWDQFADYWLTPDSCRLDDVTHWCKLPPIPK